MHIRPDMTQELPQQKIFSQPQVLKLLSCALEGTYLPVQTSNENITDLIDLQILPPPLQGRIDYCVGIALLQEYLTKFNIKYT